MTEMRVKNDPKYSKVEKIVQTVLPYAEKPLQEELKNDIITRARLRKILQLSADAFEEITADDPMENILEKRIREMIMEFLELNYVRSPDDQALEKAVKIIREVLVTKSEKESIAKHLTAELKSDWKNLPQHYLDEIAAGDGLIQSLSRAIDQGVPLHDKVIVNDMLKLCAPLWTQFIARLPQNELDRLLNEGIEILKAAENNKHIEEPLLKWTHYALSHLGIIKIMRQSFTRLLIGDLILHSVGKGLGIRGKITVTDFIILVGVKLAEKNIRQEADKREIQKLRIELEKIVVKF
ncbi:MAG: hypothetical protein AB1546_03885 [bacterium]